MQTTFNPLTGAFEAKLTKEERAARLVKRGIEFDIYNLLEKGEMQTCRDISMKTMAI